MNPETACGHREKEPQEKPLLLAQGVNGTLRDGEYGGNLLGFFFRFFSLLPSPQACCRCGSYNPGQWQEQQGLGSLPNLLFHQRNDSLKSWRTTAVDFFFLSTHLLVLWAAGGVGSAWQKETGRKPSPSSKRTRKWP